MKLISLYIEQFGGLRQYRLDFEENLTVIREENGFGKTTLAEFIRAMFYGFPRKTKQLGRRQKYLPWAGGKCAGNLEFEYQGTRYRIERTFGATPKSDTFRLLEAETNRPSTRFTENIGVELFGLDSDSFERSTYLPQNQDTGPLSTDSIRAKLGDLVEDTGDVGNFEKAAAALKAKRSSYALYRGVGGSVAEALGKISRLQIELDRSKGAEKDLSLLQGQIASMEAERKNARQALEVVRLQITRASEGAALAAVRQQHRQMETQRLQTAGELERLKAAYPKGFPSREALEQARKTQLRWEALEETGTETPEERAARQYVQANRERFAQGVPSREELEQQRNKSTEYLTLTASAGSRGFSPGEQRELEALQVPYQAGLLEETRLEKLNEKARQLDLLREKHRELSAASPEREKKPGKVLPILSLILGLGLLVAGILLLVNGQYLAGGLGIGTGLLALILGAFLGIKGMISRELDRSNSPARKGQALEQEMAELTRELEAELGRDTDFHREIRDRHLQRERYLDLEAEKRRAEEASAALLAQADGLRRELTAFLGRYFDVESTPDRYHSVLDALAREADAWIRAKEQLALLEQKRTQASQEQENCRWQLEAFFSALGLPREPEVLTQLTRMEQDALQAQALEQRLARETESLAQYQAEHSRELAAEAAEVPDMGPLKEQELALNQRLDTLNETLLVQNRRHSDLREIADRIPELEDQLAAWQEKKQGDMEKAGLLDDTLAFLQQAKDNLSNSYLGPIRAGFDRYLGKLSQTEEGRVLIDPDLQLQQERLGQARELAYFSAGQKDLLMLCMRFALVDALFTGEKPFVILDDPFVNLDDRRTAAALQLLRELSRERQILYLVCNSSRTLES